MIVNCNSSSTMSLRKPFRVAQEMGCGEHFCTPMYLSQISGIQLGTILPPLPGGHVPMFRDIFGVHDWQERRRPEMP